jgi:hypothetical protein
MIGDLDVNEMFRSGFLVGEILLLLKYGFYSPKRGLPVQNVGLLYLLFELVFLIGL